MGSRIYLSDIASDISGYKLAFVDTKNPKTTAKATSTTTVPVAAAAGTTTAITDTVASGTALKWITKPFLTAATLATSVGMVGWISGTSVLSQGLSVDLNIYSGTTETTAPFLLDLVRSRTAQTAEALFRWLPTIPTSQAFAIGDRLVIHINAVTLGSTTPTQTVILTYDGPDDALSGDTYLLLTESIRVGSRQSGGIRGASVTNEGRGQFQESINKLNQWVAGTVIASNATVQSALDDLTTESKRN